MRVRGTARALLAGLFVVSSISALAAGNSNPDLEYNRLSRPSDTIGAIGNNLFGEQVDLYSGQTSFDVTDVSIPGNGKLPVSLGRHLDAAEPDNSGPLPSFANWEVDVPYLQAYYSTAGWMAAGASGAGTTQRCSAATSVAAAAAPDIVVQEGGAIFKFLGRNYWSGITMHVPGAGSQELLVNNASSPHPIAGGPYPWVTKNLWSVGCLPALSADTTGQGGEGFVATSPDGTQYTFDVMTSLPGLDSAVKWSYAECEYSGCNPYYVFWRAKYFLLASRVVDRFGNWVKYNYNGKQLVSITASDGREIDLTWNADGTIHSALAKNPSSPSDSSRTWTYTYTAITPDLNDNPNHSVLTGVTLPDGSAWSYQYSGSLVLHMQPPPPGGNTDGNDPNSSMCGRVDPIPLALVPPANGIYGHYTFTATHPSGERGVFQFLPLIRGLSQAPYCTGPDPMYPWTRKQWALISKTLTDPTLTPATTSTWSYTYSAPNQSMVGVACNPAPCATSVWTDVQAPDGTHVRSTFGNVFELTEGQLQDVQTYTVDGSGQQTVLDDVATTYVGVPSGAAQPYPQFVGTAPNHRANVFLSEEWHPQLTHTQTRDSVSFQSTVNTFDGYANPLGTTARSQSAGATLYTRTDVATLYHDTTHWVLNQPATLTNTDTGTQVYSKSYDPATALPTAITSWGLLDASYTFLSDGSLHTVTDGNGHVTTLGNYHRGVPQSLQFADGTTKTATVDDFGHITSITDPIGTTPADTTTTATTSFGYDALGRLNAITPPAGDTVAWSPTAIAFAPVATAEFGLQAGHWKQTVTTGNATQVTYLDGLWQPVLTESFDAGNAAATQRFSTKAFDFAGRTTFASSPVASLVHYNDALAGVHTAYDGLGRPTASTQDSELGALTTSYAYLPGFITQVTNPRGFVTGTAYQVFDGPDTSHPTAIVSPEGVTTTIARDVFGKPQAITRSGTWNGSPISETRAFVYDTHQRLCKRIEPETGASFAAYDAAQNVIWTTSGSTLTTVNTPSQCEADRASIPLSSQTQRTYDARNRVLAVSQPDGLDNLSYSYFNDGALKTLGSNSGAAFTQWSYTYTKTRLPLTETLTLDSRSSTIGHAYDAYGHEKQLTYPDGLKINTAPNALGQPTQAGSYATAINYFANGGMSGFTYGNGIVHSLTQNTRELPLRSLDQAPGQPAILDDTYTYDANGNVAGIADGTASSADSRTMTYDGLDRLTQTNAPHQWWISATTTYDPLDNIRSNQVGNTASYLNTYSYDPATWHLATISGHVNWTLGYDAHGNVTGKGAGNAAYTFDAADRMQAVTGKESYRYDGYGRRVKVTRTSDGKTDYPIYTMAGQLLTEDDQRANTRTDYVSLNGSLVAKRVAALGTSTWTTTYEHTDALHSPNAETNAAGTATRIEHYTPYGEPGDHQYVQGPGYTGHVTDAATGLTYAQQRYYDPVLGRFLSVDPVLPNDNGGSFNRYWYANNNPYKFVDPDGRGVLDEIIRDIVRVLPIILPATAPTPSPAGGSGPPDSGSPNGTRDNPRPDRPDGRPDGRPGDTPTPTTPTTPTAPTAPTTTPTPNYPTNPDHWIPPPGWKETPAGDKTGGKNRQWVDPNGKIRRRWDREGREGGKERGPHWHDADDDSGGKKHIDPDDTPAP